MVASPVNTTPRFNSRSPSSSSDISSDARELSVTGESAIVGRACAEAAESIGWPRPGQQQAVGRLRPAGAQTLGFIQEAGFVVAADQHTGAQQRPLDGIGRQRLLVHVHGDLTQTGQYLFGG